MSAGAIFAMRRDQTEAVRHLHGAAAEAHEAGRPGIVIAQVHSGHVVANFVEHEFALRIQAVLQEWADFNRAQSKAAHKDPQ